MPAIQFDSELLSQKRARVRHSIESGVRQCAINLTRPLTTNLSDALRFFDDLSDRAESCSAYRTLDDGSDIEIEVTIRTKPAFDPLDDHDGEILVPGSET